VLNTEVFANSGMPMSEVRSVVDAIARLRSQAGDFDAD